MTNLFHRFLTGVLHKLVFFLHIFPTQKYKLVYFRYIQVSYEIMELEKKIKSLRYSTMEHSTFEGAFIIEIHHHRVISAEESCLSVLLKIFQFCHLKFCWQLQITKLFNNNIYKGILLLIRIGIGFTGTYSFIFSEYIHSIDNVVL